MVYKLNKPKLTGHEWMGFKSGVEADLVHVILKFGRCPCSAGAPFQLKDAFLAIEIIGLA